MLSEKRGLCFDGLLQPEKVGMRPFFLIIARNKNKAVKQLFQIVAVEGKESVQPVLSIRVGEKHCCFSITDFATQELQQLAYYTADDVNESFLWDLFAAHPELNNSYYQSLICYDHPQSTLVPLKYYKHEDAALLLKTLYGVNGTATVVSESIAEWQVYNVYAVPKDVHEWMRRKFATGKYWHQYTVGIKNNTTANAGGSIQVDFRKNDFTVLVVASNKLLLAQTFLYLTPEDVVYYLLKTCQQFGLSQQEADIQMSGLVERESALYNELHQYFLNIGFRNAAWIVPASLNNESPAHFFTSLNDLSRCAS